MSFFDDVKTEAIEKRVPKLEKEKSASDEKVKNLEAENVVLKIEVQSLNEKVNGLEAGNAALNGVVPRLAWRVKREKKAAEEAVEVAKDRGKKRIVAYSDDDDDEYEYEEEEDDEFDDLSDSANYPKDDKDEDDDDDDAQGGGGGNLQIGESGLGTPHDEESVRIFIEAVPLNSVPADTPKVIYLCHDVEEGEFVHSYSREELMEILDINYESFKFDFEEELEKINPNKPESYVFKDVSEANDFNNVFVENDTDSDNDDPFRYLGEGLEDFPKFAELFSTHNEDMLRRKVEERIRDEGLPMAMSK
ncbi:putative transcription factor bZIP family [Helianthus anomalus]